MCGKAVPFRILLNTLSRMRLLKFRGAASEKTSRGDRKARGFPHIRRPSRFKGWPNFTSPAVGLLTPDSDKRQQARRISKNEPPAQSYRISFDDGYGDLACP